MGIKNLNDQARLGSPQTMDSEVVPQTIKKSNELHPESIRWYRHLTVQVFRLGFMAYQLL